MCLHIAAFLAVYVLLQLIHCPSVDKRSSTAAPSTNKSSEDSLAKPFSSDFSATFLIHIGSLESSLVETGEIERKFSRYFQNSYQLCKFVSVLVPAYARHILILCMMLISASVYHLLSSRAIVQSQFFGVLPK